MYSAYRSFVGYMHYDYFLSVYGFLYFLDSIFKEQKYLTLRKFILSTFSFIECIFCILSKKSLPTLMSPRCSLLIILGF